MSNNITRDHRHFAFTHIDVFDGEKILKDQFLEVS